MVEITGSWSRSIFVDCCVPNRAVTPNYDAGHVSYGVGTRGIGKIEFDIVAAVSTIFRWQNNSIPGRSTYMSTGEKWKVVNEQAGCLYLLNELGW